MEVSRRSGWMLLTLGLIYIIGELGHFLIGVVSRAMAREIHYGDLACYPFDDGGNGTVDYKFCEQAITQPDCTNLTEDGLNGGVCKWDYSGLGLEYQLLAGPSFIFVFTLMGIFWGLTADRYNRVWLLTAAAFMFSLSLVGAAFATKYWHLVLSRMILAAGESGCSPLAAGMISDMFALKQRAFAMSLFNWGIYIGYGFSYAIGTYVTAADIFHQGWRAAFFMSGIPGIIFAFLLVLTVKDPPRSTAMISMKMNESEVNVGSNESAKDLTVVDQAPVTAIPGKKDPSLFDLARNPLIILLGLGACIRHSAGFCWGYNSAQYFQKYYPDYTEAGWWLMGISIGGGTAGAAIGGFVSDRLVKNHGISARAIVLAGSQLLATPFSIGLLYLDPPYAFFSLLCGYLFAEMWFGVMFAILMELVPSSLRSTALGIGLFLINNIGGNVPILVHTVSTAIKKPSGFRTAITIFYTGSLLTSSLLFFALYMVLRRRLL